MRHSQCVIAVIFPRKHLRALKLDWEVPYVSNSLYAWHQQHHDGEERERPKSEERLSLSGQDVLACECSITVSVKPVPALLQLCWNVPESYLREHQLDQRDQSRRKEGAAVRGLGGLLVPQCHFQSYYYLCSLPASAARIRSQKGRAASIRLPPGSLRHQPRRAAWVPDS